MAMLRSALTPILRLLSDTSTGLTQSFVALCVSAVGGLIAGLALGSAEGKLEQLPGLLMLVPAAIALRGNVFGALGSRLGTAIHTGTYSLSRRANTFVGQNILSALILSVVVSVLLAFLARVVGIVFQQPTMAITDYLVISVAGGLLASLVVMGITLALASGSVRFGWDLDNVTAPLVSATGDVVTVPALLLATNLVGLGNWTVGMAWVVGLASVAALVTGLRSKLPILLQIVRESLPILGLAALLSLIAGVLLQSRQDSLIRVEVLLVLLPSYLSTAGSLGGILSSRLSSRLHLGLLAPMPYPTKQIGPDIGVVFLLAVPIFILNGLAAEFGGVLRSLTSPGVAHTLTIALVGGLFATMFVVIVAYYATIVAVRFGLDPDNYGIPLVTSTLDVVGAFTFILAAVFVGAL